MTRYHLKVLATIPLDYEIDADSINYNHQTVEFFVREGKGSYTRNILKAAYPAALTIIYKIEEIK